MPKSIHDVQRKAIRDHGVQFMVKGETLPRDFHRIPSGIFALDYMLAGGFPAGVATCLYGPPGGGKSLVLQKIIANAQKLCFRCFEYEWNCNCDAGVKKQEIVYVTTEVMDIEWAKCLGVNPESLYVIEPDYGEAAADYISESLEAEDVGLVCLDSIGMLVPLAELEKSFNDALVSAQARIVTRLMRVVEARLMKEKKKGHNVTFIATNHIRDIIGGFGHGPKETVPGGWGAKHTWHLTLRMSQQSSKDKDSDTDMPINAKFRASTIALSNKRKIFMLEGACDFYVTMKDSGEFIAGTVPDWKTVEKYADEIEFIGRNPWSLFDKTYETKKALIDEVMASEELYLTLKRRVIEEYRNIAKMEMGMEPNA